MAISDEDIKAISLAVAKAIALQQAAIPVCGECLGPNSRERHKHHHDFIDELIKTMKRWNDVKWFSIKSVIGAVALTLLAGFLVFYFGVPLQKL